jgi:hypothetical protein
MVAKGLKTNANNNETKNYYKRETMAMVEDNHGMDNGMDRTKNSPRQQLEEVFESKFKAEPSIYPPNLYDVIELKQGKQIRCDHNQVEAITRKE